MTPFAPLTAVMAFESEVAMRAVADERAPELLIESSPASPRAGDDARANGAAVERDAVARDGGRRCGDRLRAARDRAAKSAVIEEHARDAARGMREIERVRAIASDDAAARDLRRAVRDRRASASMIGSAS